MMKMIKDRKNQQWKNSTKLNPFVIVELLEQEVLKELTEDTL